MKSGCLKSIWSFAILFSTSLAFGSQAVVPPETFSSNFDEGLASFYVHHSGKWEIKADDFGNAYASLIQEGEFEPPLRRPTAFLLVPDRVWSDVTLNVRARSTANMTFPGRDLVLIFGYVDNLHFYYAHISNSNNGRTHNVIMKVDGTKRHVIQQPKFPEPRLSGEWQNLRLVHQANGKIEIYVDKMKTPLMTAEDTSFLSGMIGFGSFDETGDFDEVHVEGILLNPTEKSFIKH